MTPGRKPSNTTSALSISLRQASMAAGDFRSMATERRPRAVTSLAAPPRPPLRSMRTTSAPRSDSSMPQKGPGPMPANSTTFSPLSGPWPMGYLLVVSLM